MSYTYLQEQGGGSSVESFSDIPLSVLSKFSNIQEKSSYRGKKTDYSPGSLSGMISQPLMENLGEELSMLSVEGSPARTYQQQVKVQGSKEREVGSGRKWREWFAKYNQDSCSWKTAQISLLGDLEPFLETWPRWGSMLNGVCSEQTMPVLHIKEKESGSWPTPDANMGKRGTQKEWKPIRPSGQPAQYPINQFLRDRTGKLGKPNPVLMEWLMGWPMGWTDLQPLEMGKFLL